MDADKRQVVVALYHTVLPIAKFAGLVGCIGEV
jgi:hypothetical protein